MKTDDFVKTPPPHPGSILLEEYLRPLGITPHALAMGLHVPASRVDQIIKGPGGRSGPRSASPACKGSPSSSPAARPAQGRALASHPFGVSSRK